MFKLYPQEKQNFPFKDYGFLMRKAAGMKSCLEIGPGDSTRALIEAGVEQILTLEHDMKWLDKARDDFKDFPQVKVVRFHDTAPIATCDELSGQFDFAFVDSPSGYITPRKGGVPGKVGRIALKGQEDCSRLNTCLLALKHTNTVYLHDAKRPLERGTLGRLNSMGFKITLLNISRGGFARIERT